MTYALQTKSVDPTRRLDYSRQQLGDLDSDGRGDACDPCTSFGGGQGTTFRPKIVLARINTDPMPDDDRLSFKGEFTIQASFDTIDPRAEGARLLVDEGGGENLIDVTLSAGTYAGRGTVGWILSASGKTWVFRDKTGTPANGIIMAKIQDRGAGTVRFAIKGKNGDYPADEEDQPIKVTLVLGDESASATGECGEIGFTSDECAFNKAGKKLKCRR